MPSPAIGLHNTANGKKQFSKWCGVLYAINRFGKNAQTANILSQPIVEHLQNKCPGICGDHKNARRKQKKPATQTKERLSPQPLLFISAFYVETAR